MINIKINGAFSTIVSDICLEFILYEFRFNSIDKIGDTTFPLTEIDNKIQEYIYLLYRKENNNIFFEVYTISTGFLYSLTNLLRSNKLEYKIEGLDTVKVVPNSPISNQLRDYQIEAVKIALTHKRIRIKNPTGSGKTYIIGELCRLLSHEKILIVVPYIDLSKEIKEKLETYTGMPIGYIGDSIQDIKNITVGIPNSLYKLNFLDTFTVVIYDEIHLMATFTGLTIASKCFNSKLVVGLSATPTVTKDYLLEAITGPILVKLGEKELIARNIILNPKINFINISEVDLPPHIKTHKFPIGWGRWSAKDNFLFNELLNISLVNNIERNQAIIDIVKDFLDTNSKGVILILVSRVGKKRDDNSHASIIYKKLKEDLKIEAPIIRGHTKASMRRTAYNNIRQEKVRVAIFSERIITAGIDIPNISSIILAGAGSGKNSFIQKIGRALRKDDLGREPEIWDFNDQTSLLQNMAAKRIKTANEIYNTINIINK